MLPDLIIFVGYPASGKTTISKHIALNTSFVRINQDEMRKKGQCETEFSRACMSRKKCVLLDRCNLTKAERAYWLELAGHPDNVWVVHIDTQFEECRWRITRREDHPTIPRGTGETIINSLRDKLEIPSLIEGFTRMWTLKNIREFIAICGCPDIDRVFSNDDRVKVSITSDYKILMEFNGHSIDTTYASWVASVEKWAYTNYDKIFTGEITHYLL